jgi:hypothetical protein
MPRPGRGQAAGPAGPVPGWWLAVCATAVTVVAAAALGRMWGMGLVLGPLLAIPAALAGIGAPTPRLPLACGALSAGHTVIGETLLALAWTAGILAVFATLAIRAYRRNR